MKVHELRKLLQTRCNDDEDVFFYHKLKGGIMPESITVSIENKSGASEGVILSGKLDKLAKRDCCRIGCDKPAEWQISPQMSVPFKVLVVSEPLSATKVRFLSTCTDGAVVVS